MQARITSAWNHDISTKKFIDKRKNGENVPTLEVVEVVSVHVWHIMNINKSLIHYILLHAINCMFIY